MAEVETWERFTDSTTPAPASEERSEDVALLLEARRRTALYHLQRYLTRLEEAPAASCEHDSADSRNQIARQGAERYEAERHRYAVMVVHDLFQTDLIFLSSYVQTLAAARFRISSRAIRVLASSYIFVLAAAALTWHLHKRWFAGPLFGIFALTSPYVLYRLARDWSLKQCMLKVENLKQNLEDGALSRGSKAALETWHWRVLR